VSSSYPYDPSITWDKVDHTIKIDLTDYSVTKLPYNFDVSSDDTAKTNTLYMRYIKPGTFTMGSPGNEIGRGNGNFSQTQRQVTLTEGFYIAAYILTDAHYNHIMGSGALDETRPKDNISWSTARGNVAGPLTPPLATSIAGRMSTNVFNQTGLTIAFDLPTMAQWEYACRAAPDSEYSTVPDALGVATTQQALEARLGAIAWWSGNNTSEGYPAGKKPVGLKLGNAAGLYDMIGNIYEICRDLSDQLPAGDLIDPLSTTGANIWYRGCNWGDQHGLARTAFGQNTMGPGQANQYVSFRLGATGPAVPGEPIYVPVDPTGTVIIVK